TTGGCMCDRDLSPHNLSRKYRRREGGMMPHTPQRGRLAGGLSQLAGLCPRKRPGLLGPLRPLTLLGGRHVPCREADEGNPPQKDNAADVEQSGDVVADCLFSLRLLVRCHRPSPPSSV